MAGRRRDTGRGNEAHPGPRESDDAGDTDLHQRPHEDFQPEVPRPYRHPERPENEAAGGQRDRVRRIGGGGPD